MGKLQSIKAKNIGILEDVDITFDQNKNMYVVAGKNGQGKSTFLDLLSFALEKATKGRKDIVTYEKKEGWIQIEFDDMVIERTFDKNSKTKNLVVRRNGLMTPKPQDFLNQLINKVAFDPSRFVFMDNKDRVQMLKDMLGLDTSNLEEQISGLETERRLIGRERDSYKGKIEGVDAIYFEDVPDEEVNVSEVQSEMAKANEHNSLVEKRNSQLSWVAEKKREVEDKITKLKGNLEELSKQKKVLQKEIKELGSAIDTESLNKKILEADEVNKKVREKLMYLENKKTFDEKEAKYNEFTEKIQKNRKSIVDMIEKADYPIKGLMLKDDELYLGEERYENLEESKKLKVAIAIAIQQDPELKFVLLKQGAFLDEDSLETVQKIMKAHDFVAIVEKVGVSGDYSILVEEGKITLQ